MNLIDWIIVGILGLSVLVGLYRGFIASVASMGGCLISLGISYWLTPTVVEFITNNTTLRDKIIESTGGAKLAGEYAGTTVMELQADPTRMAEAVQKINLPAPLNNLLTNRLDSVGDVTQNLGEYVSRTIGDAVMNIICFLITFVVVLILFHIVINLLNAVFKFPVLKQMNAVTGGIFGLLRGALLCFVVFALLPLFQTILPDEVNALIQGSTLAPIFNSKNLISLIVDRKL